MWTLLDMHGNKIKLNDNEVTTVGRRKTDILLENDNSISKLHAKIVIKLSDSENANDSKCMVIDAGSKYGTFIVEKGDLKRITTEGYDVQPMDQIRFGLQHHIFTVMYTSPYKYLVLISRIYDKEREELSNILKTINGTLCNEWNPKCTHITCPTVRLTEKVACALAAGLYVVTKEYWNAVSKALRCKEKLPNPANYTPKIDSSIVVPDKISLLPNPSRKFVFQDKIFIFFDEEQSQLFSRMIALCGGSSIIYNEEWKPQDCCKDNVIVINLIESSQVTQSSFEYRSVSLCLSQENLRRIPESDIPSAILCCSTEKYCNPRFRYEKMLFSKENQASTSSSSILVPETVVSDFKHPISNANKVIIKESVSIDTQMNSQIPSQSLSEVPRQDSLKLQTKPCLNIIPESLSMNSQMSTQMMLPTTLNTCEKKSITLSQLKLKEKIIPESATTDSQMSLRLKSQMSLDTCDSNSTDSSSMRQTNNINRQQKNKPRILDVETVISPIFSMRSTQNEETNEKSTEWPDHHKGSVEFDNNDNDFEILPETISSNNTEVSSASGASKKRTMDTSPVHPKTDINNKLTKKRKLNRHNELSQLNSTVDSNETEILWPFEKVSTNESKSNSLSKQNTFRSINVNSNENLNDKKMHQLHYYAKNTTIKPKCIIPTNRLTIDDMYVWKPNRTP